MSATGSAAFDAWTDPTNVWRRELSDLLGGGGHDRQQSYHALRAVLHALRDRLEVQEAADLAAQLPTQLPMLVRGFYYEGWHPSGKPLREREREQFLSHVEAAFPKEAAVDAAELARAVFTLLSRHVSAGEIEDVKANLPKGVRSLWPEQPSAAEVKVS